MIAQQNLIILIAFFVLSLVAVFILFRFLKAEAETRPLRLTGSLPGLILVFGILYLSYWRLFEKGYVVAGILILFHFLSLFGSWVLFRKLRSTARVVIDRFSLQGLLGEHAIGKFRIGGGVAGYIILYLLLYEGYYYTVDNQERIQYRWQQEAIGDAAKVIASYFDSVSNGRDCQRAYGHLTEGFIERREAKDQNWSNASEFCKFYATNRGHPKKYYKRIKSSDGTIKFLVMVDFEDEFVRNRFRDELFGKSMKELREMGGGSIAEMFQKTFYVQVGKLVPEERDKEKDAFLQRIDRFDLKDLIDVTSIHYVLRKLGIERQPKESISFFQKMDKTEKEEARSFQVKVFTLVKDKGTLRIDDVETPLAGTYRGAAPPEWPF